MIDEGARRGVDPAAKARQSETAALREALARAERVVSDREAAIAALEAALLELQTQLQAARAVGRSLIAALRATAPAPPETAAKQAVSGRVFRLLGVWSGNKTTVSDP